MSRAADLLPTLRIALSQLVPTIVRWARRTAMFLAAFTAVLLVLACTRVPYDVHCWLGSSAGFADPPPNTILVLGGSGMPSGPELLRLHHAAYLAMEYPAARVIVIHPDTAGTMRQMVSELLLRRVEPQRIHTLPFGENTREQALVLARQPLEALGTVAVVTAPENMYRSVHAFRKAGVSKVYGDPAWDHAMQHDFAYAHEAIGGKAWAPDVSESPGLRYTFWNYLKLEITCLREFVAIAYYRLNGWL